MGTALWRQEGLGLGDDGILDTGHKPRGFWVYIWLRHPVALRLGPRELGFRATTAVVAIVLVAVVSSGSSR